AGALGGRERGGAGQGQPRPGGGRGWCPADRTRYTTPVVCPGPAACDGLAPSSTRCAIDRRHGRIPILLWGWGVFDAPIDGVLGQIAAMGVARRRTLSEPVTVTAADPPP